MATAKPTYIQITGSEWIALQHVTGVRITGTADEPTALRVYTVDGRDLMSNLKPAGLRDLMKRMGIFTNG